MRPLIRNLLKSSGSKRPRNAEFLQGKDDLPSVAEFIVPHISDLGRARDIKGMVTSDPRTLEVARKVFQKSYKPEDLEFFDRVVFTQPPRDVKESGSIKVKISDIRDFARPYRDFEAARGKDVMVCVGGPAAEDQVVMSQVIDKIREKLTDVLYITRDYKESNINHSAKQSHARHGNALNADSELTGHALIPTLIMRQILGVSLEETLDSDYRKVDVKFTLDPKKIRIYFGNELNWLKQEYRKINGQLTEHDINRMEAVLSQEIMNVIEQESNLQISGNTRKSLENPSAVHVTFTEQNSEEVERENHEFARVGIEAKKLTPEEVSFLFTSDEIQSAWVYLGDTHVKFNDHQINREFAEKKGAKWLEGQQVDRILLIKGKDGNAQIAGLMTKEGKYIYANKLHFTGGYKVDYEFDKEALTRFLSHSVLRNLVNRVEDAFDLQKPLNSEITTATGVSINAVFKKSERMKRIIDKYGSTGEVAITNSHWTMIAHDDEHVVVRITGGGNTGSEEYHPAYFLNTIANTRRIFGDDLVGILSTYGCPKAVNAKNSTEFAKIAEGGVISYGKGGTGNTKRHAEAAMGLMMIGFEPEVVEYFNQFQHRNGQPIGDELSKIFEHTKNVEFLHDNVARTNRRMGYDKSLTMEEAFALIAITAAISYALYKKSKEERIPKTKDASTQTDLDQTESVIKPIAVQKLSEVESQITR